MKNIELGVFSNQMILLRNTSKNNLSEVLIIQKHLEKRGYRNACGNWNEGDTHVLTGKDGTYHFERLGGISIDNLKTAFKPSNLNDIKVGEIINYRYIIGFVAGSFLTALLFLAYLFYGAN